MRNHVLGKPEHPAWPFGSCPLAGAGLLVHAHRKRVAAAQDLRRSGHGRSGSCRRWADRGPGSRASCSWRAWACLIVAGARPRFGVYTETVTQRGVDLFVLLDVSRSMTAEDVAPNRLERAKSDVRDLLPHLAGDRVGLIVFAGKPVVKAPLTNDQGFFRMVLDEVDVGSAPRGGTLIGDAIRKALEAHAPQPRPRPGPGPHHRRRRPGLLCRGRRQSRRPSGA